MRLAPNSRKWLENGQCLWCGQGYLGHRDGDHWRKHHRLYAADYDSEWSEGQKEQIEKWANKLDGLRGKKADEK